MTSDVAMFNLESGFISFNPPSSILTDLGSSNNPNPEVRTNHDFQPIELPGENYIPVSTLATQIIAGYHNNYSEYYDADSWAKYVLEKGNAFSACKGVASFSAINSGSTGGRYWFGYAYRVSLSPYNFEEVADVEGSRAYRDQDAVLPREDYVPSSALLTKIVTGYHADSSQYDVGSWANCVLEQGKTLSVCKGVASYSGAQGYEHRIFHPVDLPGDDYIAGPTLYPDNVVAGYHDEYLKYDADSWAKYMLVHCQSYSACTVVSSFSAINSGGNSGRYWFGYVYRGGPVGPDAFRQGPKTAEVQGAHAYSI